MGEHTKTKIIMTVNVVFTIPDSFRNAYEGITELKVSDAGNDMGLRKAYHDYMLNLSSIDAEVINSSYDFLVNWAKSKYHAALSQ